jgi:hypothetical protein
MEIREKIALYKRLLSDPKLTETQRQVVAKLIAEEKQKAFPSKPIRAIEGTIHRRCSRVLRRSYAWPFVPEKLAALAFIYANDQGPTNI